MNTKLLAVSLSGFVLASLALFMPVSHSSGITAAELRVAAPKVAYVQEIPVAGAQPAPFLFPVPATEEPDPNLPAEAKEILASFEREAAAIRKKAEEQVAERRAATEKLLKGVQDRLCQEAKLDEAVAVRDTIRNMKAASYPLSQYPGSLYSLSQHIGKSFYFRITGNASGSLWGTGIYTGDSSLETAVVHMGILKVGQTGVVKVTMINSPPEGFTASAKNGVTSYSYGNYSFAFKVEPAGN